MELTCPSCKTQRTQWDDRCPGCGHNFSAASAAADGCPSCKAERRAGDDTCPQCGIVYAKFAEIQKRKEESARAAASTSKPAPEPASDRSKLVAILLCFFLGTFGIHRFYLGYMGSGIAQLLTLGGLGLWCLIDLYQLMVDRFPDAAGRKLS